MQPPVHAHHNSDSTHYVILCIHENQVNRFKFFHNGVLREGIRTSQGLYQLVETFADHEKSAAFELGSRWVEQGYATMISLAENHCSVWIGLSEPRSPYRVNA